MLIQCICSLVGSFGFCLLFQLRKGLWLPASVGGLFCWICYLAALHFSENLFFSSLVAASLATLYSELISRLLKAPLTLFVIPAIIPLVPGGNLYYTMASLAQRDMAEAAYYLKLTGQYALGIAGGIAIITTLWTMAFYKKTQKLS